MNSPNKKYQVFCILFIAVLSATLGYVIGLNNRQDSVQQQIEPEK